MLRGQGIVSLVNLSGADGEEFVLFSGCGLRVNHVKILLYLCLPAPEVLNMQPYGHSVDWWSLGILMYTLLTGEVSTYCSTINS